MEISQQKLDEFQARMSNWVASQGLLFQLTHGGGVHGAQSTLLLWIGKMAIRLGLLLAIVGVIFWGYLVKRVDFASFTADLNSKVAEVLMANDSTAGGIKRARGHLEISKMELEGGEESFFDTAEIRGLRTKMGILDGVFTTWNGETVSISRLDLTVKAGAEDNELGSRIFENLFQTSPNFKFSRLELIDATIRWGYSAVTKGEIKNSQIRATRTAAGWNLIVTGGFFSQNWLRDFEIDRMEIEITKEGVEIREAKLRRGRGTMNFTARLSGPASNPTLEGAGTMSAVPIDSYLNLEVREFVGGELSGTFVLGGSPYSSGGISLNADITLEAEDEIELRDRPNLFKAISVVDRHRSYKTIRFRSGRFKLATGGGVATFSDIWLHAKDLMRIEGEFLARAPTDKEIEEALRFERTGTKPDENPANNIREAEPGTEGEIVPEETVKPKEFNLAQAAKAARESTDDEGKIKSIFDAEVYGLRGKSKRYNEAWLRQTRIPVLEGVLRLGLHAKAFERAEELSEMYPIDTESGLRWVKVPLGGNIYEAGVNLADDILLRSRATP